MEEADLTRTQLPPGSDPAVPALTGPGPRVKTRGKSPTAIAFARLRKDPGAMTCAGLFVFFLLVAIFAPLLSKLEGQDPTTLHQDLIDQYGFPTIGSTAQHWFGVEPRLGRDLFSR